MSNEPRRQPTAVEVIPLDLTSMEEEATTWYHEKYKIAFPAKHREDAAVKIHGPRIALVRHGDDYYFVCTEGVGNEDGYKAGGPVIVNLSSSAKDTVSIFPEWEHRIPAEDLAKYATGEPVNLQQWVCSFGHRLDNNYRIWRELLEQDVAA